MSLRRTGDLQPFKRGRILRPAERAEYLPGGFSFNIKRQTRALPEPRAEDGVLQIGLRLVHRGDRETDRHGALSQTSDLGKDEPHPMALFPSSLKLPTRLLIDRGLRVDETLEVE